jgi:two-component system, cell cycle sensor histidine kinase PleC
MTVLVSLAAIISASVMAGLWWRERGRRQRALDTLHFERRRADAATAAAESAVTAANAFFDVVSHELRSPLAAIIGYQELLRDGAYGELGDGAAEPVDRIGRSSHHLLHLIDGVVDLARLRAGAVQPDLENVHLGNFLEAVVRDFRVQADERALRHFDHIEPGLSILRSDPARLARAIHLLIIAAVRSPSGDRVELHVESGVQGLTVRLRGTRIPLHEDVKDPALRTGIRLAVARATAELLGGDLRVEGPDARTAAELVLRVPATPPLPGPAS